MFLSNYRKLGSLSFPSVFFCRILLETPSELPSITSKLNLANCAVLLVDRFAASLIFLCITVFLAVHISANLPTIAAANFNKSKKYFFAIVDKSKTFCLAFHLR